MNADGFGQLKLTDTAGEANRYPAWSPDGTKLSFHHASTSNTFDIYTMNADGSDERNRTNEGSSYLSSAWFPSGDKIVFERRTGGCLDLYVMNSDGFNQTPSPPTPPVTLSLRFLPTAPR